MDVAKRGLLEDHHLGVRAHVASLTASAHGSCPHTTHWPLVSTHWPLVSTHWQWSPLHTLAWADHWSSFLTLSNTPALFRLPNVNTGQLNMAIMGIREWSLHQIVFK